jgi:hypothetical protein
MRDSTRRRHISSKHSVYRLLTLSINRPLQNNSSALLVYVAVQLTLGLVEHRPGHGARHPASSRTAAQRYLGGRFAVVFRATDLLRPSLGGNGALMSARGGEAFSGLDHVYTRRSYRCNNRRVTMRIEVVLANRRRNCRIAASLRSLLARLRRWAPGVNPRPSSVTRLSADRSRIRHRAPYGYSPCRGRESGAGARRGHPRCGR